MPDTTAQGYRIAVDPDGVPCTLVDIAGDEVTGTLWGAVRAGGAFALILTELDHFSRIPVPPTAGMFRALGDALDDDPENPHMTEGSRLWWKEEAARLRAEVDSMRGKRDRARDHAVRNEAERDAAFAEVETMQRSVRDYAADADGLREQLAAAERKLAVLKHGDGTLKLARADEWVRTRTVERQRAAAMVRLTAAAALVVGYLIGRDR